ncbi:MAG: chloride channel protein [Acidobacteria bacterium]|nr:chloride channel protein [Acidobacteriota bacterium]
MNSPATADPRDTPSSSSDRTRFALALVLVALGAAAFGIAFRLSLVAVYRQLAGVDNVVRAVAALPGWARLLVPAAGGLIAGLIARCCIVRSQGVSNVMEAVALGNVRLSLGTTGWRVAGSWIAIGAGMSLGREGPLIEFGGTLGAALGRVTALPRNRTRALVAAGTAAGFAAAYNTPFAAVLFVLETIIGIVAMDALLPTMAATVIAVTLTRAVAGGGPIYGQRTFELVSPFELLPYALLGVLAAVGAAAFKGLLAASQRFVEAHPIPQPMRAAAGGLIVGAILFFVPLVAGNGYEPLNAVLDQEYPLLLVAVLMLAKALATSGSVASGVAGGVFTPVLLLGGGLGTLFAAALGFVSAPFAPSPGSYALVGMAAMTAGAIHAPLTAAVMIFELSGDYPIVLPLLLATIVATAVSRWLGSESLYAAELRRRGLGWELTLDGRIVADAAPEPPGSTQQPTRS